MSRDEYPRSAANVKREFTRHIATVRARILERMGRSTPPDVIDDLVQQAMSRGLASAASVVDVRALRAWLLTIAERTVCDHLRLRTKRVREQPLDAVIESALMRGIAAERATEELEFWQLAVEAIDALPTDVREVGRLRFLVGDSIGTIGRTLNRSKSTVQGHVERARAALAASLSDAGYAAFLPLIDLPSFQATTTNIIAAKAAWTARRAVLPGVVTALAVALTISWDGGSANPTVSATTTADVATAPVARVADVSGSTAESSRVRVDAVPTDVIRGRVVDDAHGAPVASARVFAFDYLHLRDRGVLTDENGDFCIEATRGVHRPFDLYVEPPAGSRLGRVLLGSCVASSDSLDVRLEESVAVAVSVYSDVARTSYVADAEVAVFAITESSLYWQRSLAYSIQQVLPPHHSILARRFVPGEIRDIVFSGLPKCRLGFALVTADGRLHVAQTQEVTNGGEDRATSTTHRLRSIDLLATFEYGFRDYCPARGGMRERSHYASDPVALVADPISIYSMALVSYFGWQGRNIRDNARAFDGDLDPMPGRVSISAPSNDARPFATLSFEPREITELRRIGNDTELALIVRGLDRPATIYDIRPFTRTDPPVILDKMPTGRPVIVEVLSADFASLLWSTSLVTPAADHGTVALPQSLRAIDVFVVEGEAPMGGVAVSMSPVDASDALEGSDAGSAHRVDTDDSGMAQLSVAGSGKGRLHVGVDSDYGSLDVVEAVDAAGRARVSFDLDAGFVLEVSEGDGGLVLDADRACCIVGQTSGDRTVRFTYSVKACEAGRIPVPVGVRGPVSGQLWLRQSGNGMVRWTQVLDFQATAASLTNDHPLATLHTTAPDEPEQSVVLQLIDDHGEPLPTDAAPRIEVAYAAWPSVEWQDPEGWQELESDLEGDAFRVDVPRGPSPRLRVTVEDCAPDIAPVTPSSGGDTVSMTLQLRAAQNVFVHEIIPLRTPVDGDAIGWGLENGDLVSAIGGYVVTRPSEARAAIAGAAAELPLHVGVLRNGEARTFVIPSPWHSFAAKLRFTGR